MIVPMIRRAVIISDVHLTWRGPTAHLGLSSRLPALLGHMAKATHTELVLAGDVFDFLEAEGYAGWQPDRAVSRMQTMLTANREVTEALRVFAGSPSNRIVLLPGNHDPEVQLEAVRREFSSAVGVAVDDLGAEEILPSCSSLPEPTPYGYQLFKTDSGVGKVWVLHGDRWETANRIDRDTLRQQPANLKLPSGSRLVFDVLQQVRVTHPWIYYLDVSIVHILLLLLLVDARSLQQHASGNPTLLAKLLHAHMRQAAHSTSTFGPAGANDQSPSQDLPLIATLAECIGEAIRENVQTKERDPLINEICRALAEALDGDPIQLHSTTLSAFPRTWNFLRSPIQRAEHLSGSNATSPRWQQQLARRDLVDDRFLLLPRGVSTLIVGHTHGPRWREADGLRYVNSGTWIPVGYFTEPVLNSVYEFLRDPVARTAPTPKGWSVEVPATYVDVHWDGERGTVMLCRLGDDDKPIVIEQGAI